MAEREASKQSNNVSGSTKERFSTLERLEGSRIEPSGGGAYIMASYHFSVVDKMERKIANWKTIAMLGALGWCAFIILALIAGGSH